MEVVSIATPGLGDISYLLCNEGIGVVVDPQRDLDRFLAAAEEREVAIRMVLETHLHNDYVSGARELADRAGADLVLPAGAGAAYRHIPAFHHEDLACGEFAVRPVHTPGHTPEHVAYLVTRQDEPAALFSGGSLLAGGAGRTDLLGPERARQLARLQFQSLRRLAALPPGVRLYPTHGGGSFCAAGAVEGGAATLGEAWRTGPAAACEDEDSYAERQLAALQPYPRYYAHMGQINALGPAPLPPLEAPELTPDQVRALVGAVCLIDTRPRPEFAAGHIPGSLGLELRDDFATWAGWLLPFDNPIVLVIDPQEDAREPVVQLARIGFDRVRGVLRGIARWAERGYSLDSFEVQTPETLARALDAGEGPQVLDVRSPAERASGCLAGSVHRYLPDLLDGLPPELDRSRPVWVICASGYRATAAAGLLQREGYRPVVVAEGGVAEALRARRTPSASGADA